MYSQQWQVGLDIQGATLYSLAVRKRRYGWQLCHWWHLSLENTDLNSRGEVVPERLLEPLKNWRKRLPKKISLRITLPVSLILQQPLLLPVQPLSELELAWFVEASLDKLFPLPANELAFDYRQMTDKYGQPAEKLLITVAKYSELNRWLMVLSEVGIEPDAVDIAPSILRFMAGLVGVPTDSLLVHGYHNRLLMVAPLAEEFCFNLLNVSELDAIQQQDLVHQSFHQLSGQTAVSIGYSGSDQSALLTLPEVSTWSPLSAIQQLQPPLPQDPAVYAIACGLALRPDD